MAAIRTATSRFAARKGNPLETLAKLLESGEFYLCGCGGKAQGGGGGVSTPTPRLKPAAPAPRVQHTRAEPPEDQDSRSVLAPMMDPVAIADVQRRAAKLGVPFCEECLRGR